MIILPKTSADTFIKTTIKVTTESDGSKSWKLNLPFPVTGQIVYQGGENITYRDNTDKDGHSVVAWICYDVEQYGVAVGKFTGKIGEDPTKNIDYQISYPVTKEYALASSDVDGNPITYKGADKNDYVLFCQRLYPEKVVKSEVKVVS